MRKFLIKFLSGLLYFHDSKKRKIFRGMHDDATLFCKKNAQKGCLDRIRDLYCTGSTYPGQTDRDRQILFHCKRCYDRHGASPAGGTQYPFHGPPGMLYSGRWIKMEM